MPETPIEEWQKERYWCFVCGKEFSTAMKWLKHKCERNGQNN